MPPPFCTNRYDPSWRRRSRQQRARLFTGLLLVAILAGAGVLACRGLGAGL